MPQTGKEKQADSEKLEPLGGGFFAVTSRNHKFSLDAVLLADFAAPRGAKRLCDLCAGCGIVSLLWSAGGGNPQIDAVEIQSEAARLIEKAARINSFPELRAVQADLRTLACRNGTYDLVACNPPYYPTGAGKENRQNAALAARHETLCTLEDAVAAGSRLLRNGGRFCLCHRPERLTDLLFAMRAYRLEPKRLRFVQQRADTKPWLVLIEGKKCARPGLLAEPVLIVEDGNGGYSREMNRIYHKFDEQ